MPTTQEIAEEATVEQDNVAASTASAAEATVEQEIDTASTASAEWSSKEAVTHKPFQRVQQNSTKYNKSKNKVVGKQVANSALP